MKKLLIINLVLGSMILVGINACKKNNLVVDKKVVPPEYAGFNIYPTASNAMYNFNILPTPAPGTIFKLPVGLTTASSTDRKVKFTYSSRTAVAGAQYTAPTELTIPAGKTVDTLRIQGIFNGYTAGRIDTLTVKITNDAGFADKNGYSDSVLLIMKRTCALNIDDITGTMQVVTDQWADYSPGDLVTLTKVDATTVSFIYLADDPQPILMKINPTTYAVSVAKQVYGSGYGGASWTDGPLSVQSVAGSSSIVDPCDKTISVRLTHTVAAGSYGSYTIKFKKP
jgi:hypothetical protein